MTTQPKRNVVTTETSSMARKGFKTFPKLASNETVCFTFLGQIKDFDTSIQGQNEPYMEEISYYFDETSRSYFKFASSVSDEIMNAVKAKPSVKESKKTLAVVFKYQIDNKKAITGMDGCFIISLGSDKMKALKEIKDTKVLDNEKWSLHDVDFIATCTDDKFQKWTINPRETKKFNVLEDSDKQEYVSEAIRMINEDFPNINGRQLDDAALIEKFALDMQDDEDQVNPMAASEFSGIKKTASNPFKK